MKFLDILLEYNVEQLTKQFDDKLKAKWESEGRPFQNEIMRTGQLVPDFLKYIEQYDPTQNRKYIKWIIARYVNNGIQRLEDMYRVHEFLDTYDRLARKKQLNPEHKDINRVKTIHELKDIIDEYTQDDDVDIASKTEKASSEEQTYYDSGDAVLLYNDSEYKVVIPKTQDSSCYFGTNTQWCTASKNYSYFDSYSKDGPLYVVLHKPANRRWQLHFPSNQFMDENDRSIDLAAFVGEHPTPLYSIVKNEGGIEPVLDKKPEFIGLLKNPSEDQMALAVSSNHHILKALKGKNITQRIKNVAEVAENPKAILTLDPNGENEELQITALKKDSKALKYIPNPLKSTIIKSVEKDPSTIEFAEDPDDDVWMMAVSVDPKLIEKNDNPSPEVQRTAVEKNPGSLSLIKTKQDEEAVMIAVSKRGYLIKNARTVTERILASAVSRDGQAIEYIFSHQRGKVDEDQVPESVKRVALEENGLAIRYFKNPSEEHKIMAVKQNPDALEFIKNPSSEVLSAAGK